MEKLIQKLSEFRLFEDVSEEMMLKILNNHCFGIDYYEDDALIRSANEPAEHMYLILEGAIKGTMQDIDGHIYQVEMFVSGEIVALANIFSKKERFPISLISKGKTQLIRINRKTLVKMFKTSEKIEENFLELLSEKVQFLTNKMWEIQFYSIEQRFYHIILRQYEKSGEMSFELSDTHEELSQRLGVSRPSFSRALIKINQEGIVLFKNRKVEIINLEKLREKFEDFL
ncbi:MAG TPA: Crp/Fnr family transcriptional regulator [Thermotogota bacterium]|nr:Crp/Fnr family transcriptional regulator [Thermotogota bacterium]HPR97656.1 Crp/Fnr family transcriptional regulator [Thermotogota bacterium]